MIMHIYNLTFLLLFQFSFPFNQRLEWSHLSPDDGQACKDGSEARLEKIHQYAIRSDGFFTDDINIFIRLRLENYNNESKTTGVFWKKEVMDDRQCVVISGWPAIFAYKQPNFVPYRASFSGEWKLNESKTVSGNFLCIYDVADRMWSKTMKIAEEAGFLTITVSNSFPEGRYTSHEKLTFDGTQGVVNYSTLPVTVGSKRKKFTVNRPGDGQTMTINSVVYMDINGEKSECNITEVWKLINSGRSISVHYDVASTLTGPRHEERQYDKIN